jgi:ankyrin repeat protein
MLLNRGVVVNALNNEGESALDRAVTDDNLPMVILLARSGANVMKSIPPKEGKLAPYLARTVRAIEQTATNEFPKHPYILAYSLA